MSLQLFFRWCGYSRSPWVSFCYDRWVPSEGRKNYFKDRCLMNSQSAFPVFTSFDSIKWPYYQKHVNQITLNHATLEISFTNIRCIRSNFFGRESFLVSNSPDILALCEPNLDDSVDSGNFYVRGYHPLIWKDSITHIHGHVKEGCLFTQDFQKLRILM